MASFSLLEKVNTFFCFAFYLCMDIYNHHFYKSFVTLSYISSLIAGTLLTVCVIDGLYVPSSFFQWLLLWNNSINTLVECKASNPIYGFVEN
jgi:hypothetical protein